LLSYLCSPKNAGQLPLARLAQSYEKTKLPISEQSLGDAYLTVCLAGCGDGNGFVSKAPVDSVMGEALGRFQPPFSYTPITDGAADAR